MANQRILGIGSALVDILSQVPDEKILNELGLPKGSMTYVDADAAVKIGERLTQLYGSQRASGGSTANTMSGLARLGVESGFLSKIGTDEVGEFFKMQMLETLVKPQLLTSDTPSGRAIAMVTPDGERTFATCLGAAAEIRPDDIKPELFEGWDIFYVEGYLVANPTLLEKALDTAYAKGMTIAMDMASYNEVAKNRELLLRLLNDRLDIVFANEQESFALTGLEPEAALHYIAERCQIAVVKVGAKGAFVQRGSEVVTVPPMKADVIDTTGAGDMWASGFLAGLVKGENLEKCGMMGAIVAKNIIEVMGAKMDATRWAKIHEAIAKL
ncbi:MAG: adenosine kinase [Bacteroidales bacterium]|nr:adenosine kinase [Bacteroidales bacterium]